ncbi:MAG: thioredoxin family protein [Pyrinomonadaceae bacterium]
MKTIKILGTGCVKCKQTEAVIRETLDEMGVSVNVEKIEDIQQIMAYDVMSTPAVVLDEKVMIRGKVPSKDEIKAMFA